LGLEREGLMTLYTGFGGYYIATVIFLYPFSLPVVWEGGIWHKIWDRILQMS